MASKCEQIEAGFRNQLVELDALGTQRKFTRGMHVELAQDGNGIISGWASTPDRDAYGHEVVNGAFAAAITRRGLTGPKAIKLLLDHDWTRPAGLITTLEYRSKGLWIEAQLDLDVGYVADRYSIIRKLNGFNFSVGFMLEDYEIKTDRNKQEYLQVNRGDLFEVSAVCFPANEEATLDHVKGVPFDDAVSKLRAQFAEMKRTIQRPL
ncbi:HK97 family phage prohead protease [Mesorhizobium wenxiniae]|uniref:Prohead serine protease domain-containing protein n=1 Tax=Mesorhizobium wenxiniae TaxID=2014805 RepID=A0A271K8N0_9HYPH|nr:HK97 family phage prohead protease [Mesorhizobium wenxiniae]PAP91395.1 hypothetical protein CIT31_32485 [Mesorhizobium wenxiniae]